jgi:UDP-glucuronate 4-epimerase
MRIFVTGTAGFIGFHLAERLLHEGHGVFGFDGFTPYYDVSLKRAREARLTAHAAYQSDEAMLEDFAALSSAVERASPDIIVHLAAQAGVRYSLENPRAYAEANLTGTFNLLEVAKVAQPRHLLIASTSSVYGANTSMPFRETDRTDHPMTLYAATKKAGEDMAHAYAHLHKLPTTCFRFFTVYGPWGRPDMALFKFVDAMLADKPIEVYGEGRMRRDFTYVDDLVEAIVRLIDRPPDQGKPVAAFDSLSPAAPYRAVNIGGGRPEGLLDFIAAIETSLGKPAERRLLPMQKGDVQETWASPELLLALTGYAPTTPIAEGVEAFVQWRKAYLA